MKKLLLFLLIFLVTATFSYSQEGMWLLTQIDQLGLEKKGLEIDVSDIYNPDGPSLHKAIVLLGGGTASFVSPNGLLVTNHHVAFTAIQRVSSAETDYITKGFLARNYEDEIQAPGYTAQILTEMKDVTDKILKATKGIDDPVERDEKINDKIREITESIEGDREDINATVAEMYNGKQYFLFVYEVFSDVRIVYAPPKAIGTFGGDIDNWMWPRHTGDFSFLRVYMAPDGTGSEYDENNVPYKPEVWLKTSTGDLDDGDLTFVMGFPGTTTRYRTSNSAYWNLTYNYPFTIASFGAVIDIMDELTADDPDGKIKVADLRSGLANTMKNYQGKVEGMKKTNYVKQKKKFEKEFTEWVNSNPETKEKYGHILPDIKETYKGLNKTRARDDVYGVFQGLASSMLNIAAGIYIVAIEMDKPEEERRPGMDERGIQQMTDRLRYTYMGYYEPVDKAMLVHTLKMADTLPEGQRIEGLAYVLDDPSTTIEEWVDKAYENSKLMDMEYAKPLFGKTTAEVDALNDPFVEIVKALYPLSEEIREINNTFASKITDLRKQYIDALFEWKGSSMYPDANRTMRFTSGPVIGYSPEDAVWYYPFTSLEGVIDKNTGEEPFDVPKGLFKLWKTDDLGQWIDPELDDVPVAFLHQIDIAGGNSGSPVMNARGEIIGVVFDGNYEAMISDWQYDFDLQRAISVDIRYVLFVTEKFGDAGFILEEMGVD